MARSVVSTMEFMELWVADSARLFLYRISSTSNVAFGMPLFVQETRGFITGLQLKSAARTLPYSHLLKLKSAIGVCTAVLFYWSLL